MKYYQFLLTHAVHLVPALAGYTTQDFCVAKYEMKDIGGVATSQAAFLLGKIFLEGASEQQWAELGKPVAI